MAAVTVTGRTQEARGQGILLKGSSDFLHFLGMMVRGSKAPATAAALSSQHLFPATPGLQGSRAMPQEVMHTMKCAAI